MALSVEVSDFSDRQRKSVQGPKGCSRTTFRSGPRRPPIRLLSRQDVLRGDLLRGVRVGPRQRYEDGLAVVAQLRDGLADVGEGAVVAVLLGAVEVGPRVPAAGQLLDAGH